MDLFECLGCHQVSNGKLEDKCNLCGCSEKRVPKKIIARKKMKPRLKK